MNQIARVKLFKEIWEFWPNKDKEHAAMKALKVLCNEEDIDPKRFRAAAIIYALELRTEHCHELGNWIRNDIWKDIYSEFKDVFEYEAKLKERRDKALSLVRHWNQNKRDWWCSAEDEDSHSKNVEHALKNKFFSDNWMRAFKELHSIFEQAFPEGDWRSNTIPSLTWFVRIDYDKSTVGRIIDGEFGRKKRKSKFNFGSLFPDRETLDEEESKKGIEGLRDIMKGKKELSPGKKNMKDFLKKHAKPKFNFGKIKASDKVSK